MNWGYLFWYFYSIIRRGPRRRTPIRIASCDVQGDRARMDDVIVRGWARIRPHAADVQYDISHEGPSKGGEEEAVGKRRNNF